PQLRCQADYAVNVKRIMPERFSGHALSHRIRSTDLANLLGFFTILWRGMAPRGSSEDPKVTALRESRCLNPHPGQVTDPGFLSGEFFDARDAVQVKYEMVRRVTVDGEPVPAAAAAFGYSRPSYYQAAAALAGSGLEGLVPAKPGPRGGHKPP